MVVIWDKLDYARIKDVLDVLVGSQFRSTSILDRQVMNG